MGDSKVKHKAIESILLSRIPDIEDLKELEILKIVEVPSPQKLEQVERNLFSQITNYNEYEVPTNECICAEIDLSAAQWDRLSTKIDECIHKNAALPVWEQVLMATEIEPLQGLWENIEESLFERINEVSGLESWEQCARLDEIHIQKSLDAVEMMLDTRIKQNRDLKLWEYVIRTEKVLSYHHWEKIEEKVFSNIYDNRSGLSISKQPFWNIIHYYLLLTKVARIATIVTILALMVAGGFFVLQQLTNSTIPTVVYQLQGNAAANANFINGRIGQKYNSVEGGSVSLVSSHGLIELQNGSDIKIQRLTKQHAWYKVEFNSVVASEITRGSVSFLVNPHQGRKTFRVQTPDYQVVVKGTYFKVEPDLIGKISTSVLEGEVKIVSNLFKSITLKAGESLIFDTFTSKYMIQNGGVIVHRKELKNVPTIEELLQYKKLALRSSVIDADVKIDERNYGTAPLDVSLPIGIHHVSIGKKGYASVDTLITLSHNDTGYLIAVSLNAFQKQDKQSVLKGSQVKKATQKVSRIPQGKLSAQLTRNDSCTVSRSLFVDSLCGLAQAEELKGNWKEAILLYQKVFDNLDVSQLRKEDALFSIGKLNAENEPIKTEARQTFLTYLALYPGGFFAGETWLRLAELEFKTNPQNAVKYYLKYFEMFPHHPRISELQNRVGVIYLQQKKYDDAIFLFKQALSNMISLSKDERENITSNLHRALEAKGDRKSADTVLDQYILNFSNDKK